MALRRALSLRSLLGARCYQPSCFSSIIRHDNNDHHEEKPNHRSFLVQRSFSSSILSRHPRSCSHSSLCTPFGVSIYHRSMSSSSGSDESGNLNDSAATPTDSVVENVVCHVPSEWSFHFDSVQRLIETVHSFTGMDWCASIILTTLLIRGVTIPLMIYHEREWSRTMMLLILAKTCKEIRDPDAFATRKREIENMVKENDGVPSVSALLPFLHVPALICMGTTIHNMTGGWSPDLSTIKISLLNGFIFWISVEYDAIVGFEGARIDHRNLSRKMVIPVVFAGLLLSKEVHCYLMTCMLFSIAFMHEIGRPGVKTLLGIPEVPQYTLTFSLYGKITVSILKKIFKQ